MHPFITKYNSSDIKCKDSTQETTFYLKGPKSQRKGKILLTFQNSVLTLALLKQSLNKVKCQRPLKGPFKTKKGFVKFH
jgi:hypothetical protein